jgi:hypothetical protein
MTDKTAGVGPVERGVRWLAGWYATRLHAVPEDQAQATKDARQALCGAWVYGQARTEWAEKRGCWPEDMRALQAAPVAT